MTQIEQIKQVMKDKDKMHYKEIATATNINVNSTRAILNGAVKKGIEFERIGAGYYKLK